MLVVVAGGLMTGASRTAINAHRRPRAPRRLFDVRVEVYCACLWPSAVMGREMSAYD